ncbi:MAG: PSD1 and planctomycete cytochrome C domain-containing protein [Bryobacterales bacterium]|nr:PSD1 and planctomycete cytochrome C domain-containing protein [Bryobacterales bacterium]
MTIRVVAATLFACAAALAAERVEFNRDVRPILSENCFACHGPDRNARQAGLRLDKREEALARGVIRPGDAAGSRLVQRVRHDNPALAMPPPAADKKLTAAQKQVLASWIEQGAEYQQHWAYLKPRRPAAPAGPQGIDHLVNRRLAERGLRPVPPAGRRTLARRLSFDLTGLPPDPALVESFARDERPAAYERLLDALLASPHYGERMATHWLDLVRYADTVGYHGDVPVSVYPFRDYVVRSFNENKPFDAMSREQLAGDLLHEPTPWQLVASGYNRLSRMTNEGGAQAREYLAKYAADRVRNVSAVWLGSTLGCAECHDHKFDPFSAEDFYSMAAFFADIEEEGVFSGNGDWGASVRVLVSEARGEMDRIERELAALRPGREPGPAVSGQDLDAAAACLRADLLRWKVLDPDRAWADCTHPEFDQCGRFALEEEADGVVRVTLSGGKKPSKSIHRAEIPLRDGLLTAVALELYPTGDYSSFYLSEFEIRLLGRERWPVKISLRGLLPDHEGPGSMLRDALDGNYHTGWHGKWAERASRSAVFTLAAPLRTRPGERLQVTLIGYSRHGFGLPSRFRLLGTDAAFPELPARGDLRSAVLAGGARSAAQQSALRAAAESLGTSRQDWRRIRALERRRKELLDGAHESLVARAVRQPRAVRVLPRGNWMDDSGQPVQPQVPRFLGPLAAGSRPLTRLDLADWLTHPDNPLTARVFVNRLWGVFFGAGLSKVLDDLGSQGEPPVNQELLDWLAVEFVESGWDVRHVVRTMLLSETYRRSSEPSDDLLASDPYNRLHGRQSMARLDAEFLRDNALAVSGLLNRAMGGPSVKPYQPPGYYKELNFPKRLYEADLDQDQFRRSLYAHWQRQYLHPALKAFDAPAREECAAQRGVSNTPLQSLVLLNDPSYVEAARAFAARVVLEGGRSAAKRIDFAFREAFSRPPSAAERAVLLDLLERHRARFRADPRSARQLLGTGISRNPAGVRAPELAAWTSVARALYNKHEFLTRY